MRIGTETTAVVTGASAGIGRALAVALAARGATVGLRAERAMEAMFGMGKLDIAAMRSAADGAPAS